MRARKMPAPLRHLSLYAHIENIIGYTLSDVNFTFEW